MINETKQMNIRMSNTKFTNNTIEGTGNDKWEDVQRRKNSITCIGVWQGVAMD
jgi:hypothetical protein